MFAMKFCWVRCVAQSTIFTWSDFKPWCFIDPPLPPKTGVPSNEQLLRVVPGGADTGRDGPAQHHVVGDHDQCPVDAKDNNGRNDNDGHDDDDTEDDAADDACGGSVQLVQQLGTHVLLYVDEGVEQQGHVAVPVRPLERPKRH